MPEGAEKDPSTGKNGDQQGAKPDGAPIGVTTTVTLIVGVFAVLGISGDYLPRLVRDDPDAVSVVVNIALAGAVAIAIGVAVGSFPSDKQRWWHHLSRWLAIAGALVVLGAAFRAVDVGTDSMRNREQPRVALSAQTEGNTVTLTVDASGSGLPPEDAMLVQLIGLEDLSDPLQSERGTCEQSQVERAIEDGSSDRLLAWERLGPDSNGTVRGTIKVEVTANAFEGICAFGALADDSRLRTADLNTLRATATYIRMNPVTTTASTTSNAPATVSR
ncbi:MAG: hypothetical protein ACRDSK_02380 [Actinophytocola sp.]|uniref:hypothetical protein n=1 Tax=Actinophytocola sp. TaxID=1872138 RepID=UPI003D6B09D6